MTYPDRLLLKARVIMSIRYMYTAWALRRFLDQVESLAQQMRCVLSEHGRFPCRQTWERRLQLVLLYHHEQHLPIGVEIKPLLRAA